MTALQSEETFWAVEDDELTVEFSSVLPVED
jgi:hypothetical protein